MVPWTLWVIKIPSFIIAHFNRSCERNFYFKAHNTFFPGNIPLPPPRQYIVGTSHGRMNYKTPNPICLLFFKIDLLAALCLTDCIDWRYIHSWLVFSTQLVNCWSPWTKELYILCTVAPLPSLWPPPIPKPNVQYIQTVCGCVGVGRGGGVELCCRPYSAGV